ncbi:MAG: hypothetical protein ACFCUW_03360 [Kiloniellaceae bacterium]
MSMHAVPHPDYSLSEIIGIRSIWSLAAGTSAALSFLLVRRFDWRVRVEPLLGRALVVGIPTVAVAHLLIGVVYSSMLLFVRATFPETPFWAGGDLLYIPLGMSVFSVVFGWYLTLPFGIAAAALVEWLERRSPSPSSV